MEINDEFDINIISLSDIGEGIGMIGEKIIFVPRTKPGDSVKVRITEIMNKTVYGVAIKILEDVLDGTETGEEDYSGEDSFDYEQQ